MANPLKRAFGDPTHPAVVHFPLALYPATVLFDILAFTRSDGSVYTHGAFILIIAASIAAVGAAITGFAQLPDIPPGSPAWKTAILHMSMQMTAAVIFLVSLLLRLKHVDDAHPPIGAFICAVIGLAALFYGGWLGGRMVFSQGVGVEMAADGQMPRATDTEPVAHTDAPTLT